MIRTAFSAITYKDAMAARGVGKNVRTDRPCVTGVDFSGVVVRSEDDRSRKATIGGDQLPAGHPARRRLRGLRLRSGRMGGAAAQGLSLYEAMGLGTSGLTAAAVDRFEKAGLKPGDGPVAVTGATGGVGSTAVDMLAGKGYEVVAISGKADQADYLKAIGAARVLAREDFMKDKSSLVGSPPFAGALDNVGGAMLDRLAANLMPHGKVTVAGMVGVELTTTVLPLVLRSIDILGINVSRQLGCRSGGGCGNAWRPT